jgi:CRP-like cAMP-binding protein
MPDSLFFIMEGDVEMLDEGAVLRLLKTGDTFGEEAVLCNITTPLEYKSSSFCRVLLMPRAELQHVLEKSPAENRVMQNNVLTHLQSWIQEETDRFARAEVRRGFESSPSAGTLTSSG